MSRDHSGFRGMDWSSEPLASLLADADLSVTMQVWVPPLPDPLTVSNWWTYREPCDCPDTSFGRRPHGWDCEQTPIYAQLMRDIDTWRMT